MAPSAVDGLRVSDIGGHRLSDGRWFRTGLVFRISGGMVGAAELAHLDTLGLRVLVDLRGEDEDRREYGGAAMPAGHYNHSPSGL